MKNMSDENLKSFIEKLGKMSESLMATSLSLQSTVKDLIDFKQLNSEEHKRIFNILELTTKRTENLETWKSWVIGIFIGASSSVAIIWTVSTFVIDKV